jgi:hypothetical protein
MNSPSAEPLVKDQELRPTTNVLPISLILTAWSGTLLLSRLPQILLGELGLFVPTEWSLWWWIVIGLALLTLTYIWPAGKG